MEATVGVFVCTGCEIGEAVDVEALTTLATGELGCKACQTHGALCSDEGLAMIQKTVADEGLNRAVVAACSPRAKTEVFGQLDGPEMFTDRASLRELVAWTCEPKHEDTQLLAEDYLRMSVVKVQKGAPPEPHLEEITREVLVIGGGWSGLTAALEAARAGVAVRIIEKEARLGGRMLGVAKRVPTKPPFQAPEVSDLPELIRQVEANDKITVHLATTVEKMAGQPGVFDVTLAGGETFRTGAVVLATGYQPYDASKLEHLGYGASPDVITNHQLERMLKDGQVVRPSTGQPVRRVAFVQCAGSRDQEHLAYCSGICCAESLKQARLIRDLDDQAQAYILYRDLRTPGQLEDFYRAAQDDPGIFLTKCEVGGVKAEGQTLVVDVANTILGDVSEIEADLVVLATGMVPDVGENNPTLQLEYRQGPDMPFDDYGFPDSNYICFPYETQRTAIYAAGPVRQPMDALQSRDDATGAALKAIQALERISTGYAVHPRTHDNAFPEFFLQRCTQCKRCTEECPFGALNEDEKGTPQPNPTRCRRCGICFGACPERIISFKNYNIDQMVSSIKATSMPEEDEEKPRVLALVCENDAYPSLDIAALNRRKLNPFVRFVPVRCLGSVNTVFIADSLSAGYDGILLIGCKHGDDYQCHFIRGSELANTRMENVQETLQRLVLEPERVQIHEFALNEWEKIPALIDEFMETVEELGANPYKDM